MPKKSLVNRNKAHYLREWGGEIAGVALSTLVYIAVGVFLISLLIAWRVDWCNQRDNERDIEADAEKEFKESDYYK